MRAAFGLVLVLCALVCMSFATVAAVHRYAQIEVPEREPQPAGPDISTCPDNITLWDCIQHAQYGGNNEISQSNN